MKGWNYSDNKLRSQPHSNTLLKKDLFPWNFGTAIPWNT